VDPSGPQQNETESRGNPKKLYRAYEKGAEKWRKEHIPRRGQGDISEEGQELLDDKDKWENETSLLGGIHESRKRESTNDDGSFMTHRKGPITSTFTAD
jgi:hypothetical protein